MKNCIFCDIVNGKIKCHKLYESKEFLAFLDLYPNTKGMALVITKKHYHSDAFEMPEKDYLKMMIMSRKISNLLKKKLKVKRVAMVMEGLGVNHVHIKLYPLHGLKKRFGAKSPKKRIFFKRYMGYINTLMGKRAKDDYLVKLANKIRGKNGN